MQERLRFYQDFPVEGVNFIDIFPLLQSREAFAEVTAALCSAVTAENVVAPEARAFLFAAPLLTAPSSVHNLIPMRKSGKLPFAEGDLVAVEITKEYGKDCLYYRKSDISAGVVRDGFFHIAVVDDILATGGTALGIAKSLESMQIEKDGQIYGVKVDQFVFLGEIACLGGRALLEQVAPVTSVMTL